MSNSNFSNTPPVVANSNSPGQKSKLLPIVALFVILCGFIILIGIIVSFFALRGLLQNNTSLEARDQTLIEEIQESIGLPSENIPDTSSESLVPELLQTATPISIKACAAPWSRTGLIGFWQECLTFSSGGSVLRTFESSTQDTVFAPEEVLVANKQELDQDLQALFTYFASEKVLNHSVELTELPVTGMSDSIQVVYDIRPDSGTTRKMLITSTVQYSVSPVQPDADWLDQEIFELFHNLLAYDQTYLQSR